MQSGEVRAARRVRSELKSNSLLREVVSRFSQQGDLVVALLTGKFSTAMAHFTVLSYPVSAKCELDPGCLPMTSEAVVGQSGKPALDAGTDAELSTRRSEAAVKAASLAPETATADRLWSVSDGLPLYHCTTRDVLTFLEFF